MYVNGKKGRVCPLSGPVKFGEIDGWVQNQEKQGFVCIWFKTQADYETVIDHVEKKKAGNLANVSHKLYRLDGHRGWVLSDRYADKKQVNFVGYDDYVRKLEKDIANYMLHHEYLKSVGENKSLNYLFYGKPGCGKTSLALLLASKFDYPIYVMNDLSRSYSVLTPTGPGMKILLFEDFDRYLSGKSSASANNSISDSGHMSDILNSLDGVNSGDEIIRIFTGNDCKIIFENEALINRMSCCLKFDKPSRSMFEQKFKALLPNLDGVDDNKLQTLLDQVDGKVTLRPFVNYVIRYMFEENYLDDMIGNISELIRE